MPSRLGGNGESLSRRAPFIHLPSPTVPWSWQPSRRHPGSNSGTWRGRVQAEALQLSVQEAPRTRARSKFRGCGS